MADGGKNRPLVMVEDPKFSNRKIMRGRHGLLFRYFMDVFVIPPSAGAEGDIFYKSTSTTSVADRCRELLTEGHSLLLLWRERTWFREWPRANGVHVI